MIDGINNNNNNKNNNNYICPKIWQTKSNL